MGAWDWQERERAQRAAVAVYRLGERALCEMIIEANALEIAEKFATIDPDVLRALGGDRSPRRLRAVS